MLPTRQTRSNLLPSRRDRRRRRACDRLFTNAGVRIIEQTNGAWYDKPPLTDSNDDQTDGPPAGRPTAAIFSYLRIIAARQHLAEPLWTADTRYSGDISTAVTFNPYRHLDFVIMTPAWTPAAQASALQHYSWRTNNEQ